MKKMNVLIACEESQTVCKAFREKGHNAFSCDIQEPSGGHPEYHILGDVIPIMKGGKITTMDGVVHDIDHWDLMICHPECTHLAVSGSRFFEKKRADGRQRQGIEFFCKFLESDIKHIAIENPVGIISGDYVKTWFPDLCEKYGLPRKYTQIIQPYEFGHPVSKKTCLWLKNLPPLVPTNIVEPEIIHSKGKSGGYSGPSWLVRDENGKILSYKDPRTAKARSKTYEGIAQAMADQWGNLDDYNE